MATVISDPTILAPDEKLYEVINGQVVFNGHSVEKAPMASFEEGLGNELNGVLRLFLAQHPIGRSFVEVMFDFTEQTGNKLRPDVSFVSVRQWPLRKHLPPTAGWKMVPELAVEIVCPTNTANEVANKTAEYFQAGVSEVWIVMPTQSLIYRYASQTDVRVFKLGDVLTTNLLPGFELSLSELFATDEDT